MRNGVASKRHCERYVVKDSAGATRALAVRKGVLKMNPRLNISVVARKIKKGINLTCIRPYRIGKKIAEQDRLELPRKCMEWTLCGDPC